jgi:hypothetical protein
VQSGRLPAAVLDFLRHALDAATHNVYVALTAVAVLAGLVLLVCPRRFPVIESAPIREAADEPGAG